MDDILNMGKYDSELIDISTIEHISTSRQEVTMLFTDIKDSTKLWESMGDVAGRMMIDEHNKLLFPVIRKFKGKLVKTIGDAIMARFKNPGDAIKAAIAMQQVLDKYREEDKSFKVKIRIGIHTGTAVVEKDDVYGDVVNVAARIEARARTNQILVSGAAAAKVKNTDYSLIKHGAFTPKGKSKEINLFKSDWKKHEDLTELVKVNLIWAALLKHGIEIPLYMLTTVFLVAAIFFKYLRYILADNEAIALNMLNPQQLPSNQPITFSILLISSIFLLTYLIRLAASNTNMLKFFRGAFIFTVTFMLLQTALPLASDHLPNDAKKTLYESKHLFVEIKTDDTWLRDKPSTAGEIIGKLDSNTLLLLNDIKKNGSYTWNKVLIDKESYGWVARKSPEKLGIPEKVISTTNKFYFTMTDVISLIAAFIASAWGFLRFRIKPL